MKLQFALIRSGMTIMEEDGIFLGEQDTGLSVKGTEQLRKKAAQRVYPEVPLVYTSPMLRSRETAGVLYPSTITIVLNELRPMEMGRFAGRNFRYIQADPEYRAWAESKQADAFPQGENPYLFRSRSVHAFTGIVDELNSKGIERAAIILHRMVMYTILDRFVIPRAQYRSWERSHGDGYLIEFDSAFSAARILKLI